MQQPRWTTPEKGHQLRPKSLEALRSTTPKKALQHPTTKPMPKLDPHRGSTTLAPNQEESTLLKSRSPLPDPEITTILENTNNPSKSRPKPKKTSQQRQ